MGRVMDKVLAAEIGANPHTVAKMRRELLDRETAPRPDPLRPLRDRLRALAREYRRLRKIAEGS
jgi:hypothetical protein